MGEAIRFWLVYRVACPDDANRWSCFADEANARSICATANKAWGEGTWDVREATLDGCASAERRGLERAASIADRNERMNREEHPTDYEQGRRGMADEIASAIRRAAEEVTP